MRRKKTQTLKLWPNSKTRIVIKLKNSNCVKTQIVSNSKTKIRSILKTRFFTKHKEIKLWKNSETKSVKNNQTQTVKNSNVTKCNCDKTQQLILRQN